MIGFHQPSGWLLLLLPLAGLAWWRWSSVRRRAQVAHPIVMAMEEAGTSIPARLRHLPAVLRTLAMVLLVVAIARPLKANEQSRVTVEGIAIELVLDRSISMGNDDFVVGGRPIDRLGVVKRIVEDFVVGTNGADGLRGRPDDLIGLVTFAKHADSVCPPTLDQGHVVQALRQLRVANTRAEDGTAIGDGVALGVERLRELIERPVDPSHRIRSTVLVLLTDGENNAGDIDPATAAELAQTYGIRIYAIGAGNAFARAQRSRVSGAGGRGTPAERTLRDMAEKTGGRFFVATNASSLVDIYKEIDRLERTETEQRRYRLEKDLAVEGTTLGGVAVPALLTMVFGLLLAEGVLSLTRIRPLT
ncbi:MAG: VWA domain-containing protein [Phycisphaerales bacterium]|nr:VWA domain-containing protein [Phycisphaerales bacterium]